MEMFAVLEGPVFPGSGFVLIFLAFLADLTNDERNKTAARFLKLWFAAAADTIIFISPYKKLEDQLNRIVCFYTGGFIMSNLKPQLSWLDEPTVTQVGRLTPSAALSRRVMGHLHAQKLNGTWKVCVSPSKEDLQEWEEEAFIQPEGDVSAFDDIQVPAHLQLCGYGMNQYTNTAYPWDGKEAVAYGRTPSKNLTARYVLDFDVDPKLVRDHVRLVFHGVESAFYVWLNGEFVGYSTDSFTPSAFDVTDLLKDSNNRLSVLVFQYSSGSWLEDQDFFRFSGIFRDVELQGAPKASIEDLRITTELSDDFTSGSIVADFKDRNASAFLISLFDPDSKRMFSQTIQSRSIRLSFDDVRLWSAEQPSLYTLRIEALDENGDSVEMVEQKVGMRRVEVRDGLILLNGRRLMLHGVNRHEFHCRTGRVMNKEQIKEDLLLMKRNNINAVRTSHYPNQDALYDLADEIGLYVMDEANLETHGTWQSGFSEEPSNPLPGDRSEWKKAVLERAQAMFERDKNHPSILFWSLGNESWYGDDLLEEAAWLRVADPTRLVHYESCFRNDDYADCTDVISRMYPSPEEVEEILKSGPKKPVILCEYMHGMGNSLGGMYRYSRLEEYRQFQGGFLWDFADQALEITEDGQTKLCYGGDFQDVPNSGNFSGNGILFADHTPSEKLDEVKALFAPIRVLPDEKGVEILNTNLFTDTDLVHFIARQKMEGRILYEEEFDVHLLPGQFAHVDLDWLKTRDESVCEVSVVQASQTKWAPEGYEIAFGQRILPGSAVVHPIEKGMKFVLGKELFGAHFGDVQILFGLKGLVSMKKAGKEWLLASPRPVFSHAYTDNERGFDFDRTSAAWFAASLFTRTVSRDIQVCEEQGYARITYTMALPYPASASSHLIVTYFVSAPGNLGIRIELPGNRYMPDLPVFGMEFKLPKSADRYEYYGFGPHENYKDRSWGARLDVFASTAKQTMQPYLKPQECGNRCAVRWVEFEDDGQVLRFERTAAPFEISVLPYSFVQIQEASHQHELPKSTGTYVRIASEHMGVGGVDSWGTPIHSSDRLNASKSRVFNFMCSFVDPDRKTLRNREVREILEEQIIEEKTTVKPEGRHALKKASTLAEDEDSAVEAASQIADELVAGPGFSVYGPIHTSKIGKDSVHEPLRYETAGAVVDQPETMEKQRENPVEEAKKESRMDETAAALKARSEQPQEKLSRKARARLEVEKAALKQGNDALDQAESESVSDDFGDFGFVGRHGADANAAHHLHAAPSFRESAETEISLKAPSSADGLQADPKAEDASVKDENHKPETGDMSANPQSPAAVEHTQMFDPKMIARQAAMAENSHPAAVEDASDREENRMENLDESQEGMRRLSFFERRRKARKNRKNKK